MRFSKRALLYLCSCCLYATSIVSGAPMQNNEACGGWLPGSISIGKNGHGDDDDVFFAGIYHDQTAGYFIQSDQSSAIKIRTAVNNLTEVNLWLSDGGDPYSLPMKSAAAANSSLFQYWAAEVPTANGDSIVWYRFELKDGSTTVFYNQCGPSHAEELANAFWIVPKANHPPSWASKTIWYQIFPDRFVNGDESNDEKFLQLTETTPLYAVNDWSKPPESNEEIYGGDLNGVIQKLDYLRSKLGINGIYLNPIVEAASNHRYNALDFMKVAETLGGDQALRDLIKQAHSGQNKMRIVLDAVVNHVSEGHPWSDQYSKNDAQLGAFKGGTPQTDSEFYDYFWWSDGNCPAGKGLFEGWYGYCSLPKLNLGNSNLMAYIERFLTVYLTDFDADGWRFDVAYDLKGRGDHQGVVLDAHTIFKKFRETMRSAKSDAIMIGETLWDERTDGYMDGTQMDGVMNYDGFASPV